MEAPPGPHPRTALVSGNCWICQGRMRGSNAKDSALALQPLADQPDRGPYRVGRIEAVAAFAAARGLPRSDDRDPADWASRRRQFDEAARRSWSRRVLGRELRAGRADLHPHADLHGGRDRPRGEPADMGHPADDAAGQLTDCAGQSLRSPVLHSCAALFNTAVVRADAIFRRRAGQLNHDELRNRCV